MAKFKNLAFNPIGIRIATVCFRIAFCVANGRNNSPAVIDAKSSEKPSGNSKRFVRTNARPEGGNRPKITQTRIQGCSTVYECRTSGSYVNGSTHTFWEVHSLSLAGTTAQKVKSATCEYVHDSS